MRQQAKIEDALRAAQRYYLQNATMEMIAREMRTSRSTVSRLVSYAVETGLVEIRIMPPVGYASEVEQQLTDQYHVQAHVVHVSDSTTPVERHQRTAAQASRVLNTTFSSDMILAIAWGTMLREISDVLTPKAVTNCRVVQLNGIGHSRSLGEHYSTTVLAAFGTAYNAEIRRMAAPLFFDRSETRANLFAERSIQDVVALQRDADVALFSLGTVDDGVPAAPYCSGHHLTDRDFAALKAEDVVCDLATTFIRADGTYDSIAMNDRTSGPDLDTLSNVPHRICAVSGDRKVRALRAALLSGMITDLVIDESTARMLLQDFPTSGSFDAFPVTPKLTS